LLPLLDAKCTLDESKSTVKDVYLVFPEMDMDLKQYMAARPGPLSAPVVKSVVYQLLLGVQHMHARGVLHRDIKPGNILLGHTGEEIPLVKLADFGLARGIETVVGSGACDEDKVLTDYVVSRWYRAPEILMRAGAYGTAVDVWSVGCVMAEMLQGVAAFRGGNTIDQVKQILTRMGKPDPEDYKSMPLPARMYLKRFAPSPDPDSIFDGVDADAADLLRALLHFDPAKRASASAALSHPFFADIRSELAEAADANAAVILDPLGSAYPPFAVVEPLLFREVKECNLDQEHAFFEDGGADHSPRSVSLSNLTHEADIPRIGI